MKTLDEVIKALEICTSDHGGCEGCPYDPDCTPNYKWDEAIFYLKEYQRYQNTPSCNGHIALVDYFEEQQKNEPLTWEELKQMEGKPVWVEALLYKQWAVIAYVGDDHIRFEGVNLYAPESRIYMGEENGWQAYRKERTE